MSSTACTGSFHAQARTGIASKHSDDNVKWRLNRLPTGSCEYN